MVKKNSNKRAPKKASKAAKASATAKATRELKARHLASLCAEIESKRSASGRIPRGEISKVFNEQKPIYTWLTMDIIKKGLKRAKGSKTSVLDTVMSDLTEDTGDFPALNDVSNIPPPSSIGFSQPPPSPTEIKNKKGGRPTGATLRASREKRQRQELLINDIATEWSEKVKLAEGRMKKNELDELINKKKSEHDLTDLTINKSLIRQRIQKKN